MKSYLLLMYLNDLVRVQPYFNLEIKSKLTEFMDETCDKLSLKDLEQVLKRYIFLSNKRKVFVYRFISNDSLSWFICDIIAYLKVYLPTDNKSILQEIEDLCNFDKLKYEEMFKISNQLDKIIDKL